MTSRAEKLVSLSKIRMRDEIKGRKGTGEWESIVGVDVRMDWKVIGLKRGKVEDK
jgi:hypothetical protein